MVIFRFKIYIVLFCFFSITLGKGLNGTETKDTQGKSFTKQSSEKKNRPTDSYPADFDSENPDIQISACRTSGEKRDKSAIKKLIWLIENSPFTGVKWQAAAALGMIAEPGISTDALISAATKSKSKSVRYAALIALSNIQDKDKQNQIIRVMKWTRTKSDDRLAVDLVERFIKKIKK